MKYVVTSKGCFEQRPATVKRPQITFGGKQRGLARVVASITLGLDLDDSGVLVRHICNNSQCFRSSHLILGDHSNNALDAVRAGVSLGGPVKVSPAAKEWIKRTYKAGNHKQKELALMFGVTVSTISLITKGRWSL